MKNIDNEKMAQLGRSKVKHDSGKLTTDQGVGVANTDDSLKAGSRGPTLLEDFIFREKITHFDHERIPERIVHARGTGAHGHFQVYEDMSSITKAHFLGDPKLITPVFVRFSTVAGFRGSPDTVRDVRGFAVKFYTQEGNYDMVGNNMPVFFIQDAIKFPDLIHALKPEPNNEIPQAQSAHNTFWDFVTTTPETAHTVMWLMSDRAIPRSYRMMEGFGIHTFKLINSEGQTKFVKFHWKPLLGVHSLVWDETQKIAGKDPDFNRRDLWENIENGNFPEWELGIQLLDLADEFKFDFDVLDCTKLWPEEIIPVKRIGKMTLDRNVTNFFAETEQVAFCPANLVPGIDFTNDPMLQGRIFSYLDTQISRLGGVNFHQIPINSPLVKVNNNERDGMHRVTIDEGVAAYFPNALQRGEPHPARVGESAYAHHQQKVEGQIIRARSESFNDFYSQATLFWNSMSAPEKQHIVDAFRFELSKVTNKAVRQAAVDMFNNVSGELAVQIASGIGATPPQKPNKSPIKATSPALSMANTTESAATKKVAVILENGFNKAETDVVLNAITAAGASYEVISSVLGQVTSLDNKKLDCVQTYATTASVLYDALYIGGGKTNASTLMQNGDVINFINETYKHFKPIAISGESVDLLTISQIKKLNIAQSNHPCTNYKGVIALKNTADMQVFAMEFIRALSSARNYERADN